MIDEKALFERASAVGFSHVKGMEPSTLRFLPEVRQMCAADRCHSYGKTWVCPPACGTLEEVAQKAASYGKGILLQSTGTMEDDFDIDTMRETERRHKEQFLMLMDWLDSQEEQFLSMAAGGCTLCAQCTYPDAPCRFPRRAAPSMEAYGLWVSRVCEDADMPYSYGRHTITYTSCILYSLSGHKA